MASTPAGWSWCSATARPSARLLAQATDSAPFAFLGADNASISKLVVTEERWVLRGYNDIAHLSD